MNEPMEAWMLGLSGFPGAYAYALTFLLLVACGAGAPMNEDIVLLIASALTLRGAMEPVPLLVVGWFGVVGGDALIFHWGRRFGPGILRTRFVARTIPPARYEQFRQRFQRWGPAYLFVVRFLPGVRTPLFFTAGTLRLSYRSLFLYDGLAALVHLPAVIFGVRFIGGRWQEAVPYLTQIQNVLLSGLAVIVSAFLVQRWRKQRCEKGVKHR